MDEIIRAIAADGMIRMTAVDSRDMVERMRVIHGMSRVITAAAGRTITATSIIGSSLKGEDDSVTVRINGGGPAGTILCVSDSGGNARGYAANCSVELPLKPNGKLDVSGAVGTHGMLTVIKDLNLKEPYVGSVELVSGEIAEDFTSYFASSEQTPSACALGVLVGPDGAVRAAGGYLVQLMPGADDAVAAALEQSILQIGAVTGVLDGGNAEDLMRMVLVGFDPVLLDRRPVSYRCYCSREKVLAALAGIDRNELEDMRRENKPIEVTCQFCDRVYTFSPDELG
ncbi:MAG: Hsp33 family molecular chaperone HslO [Oscillospiraceae bacterium]|nr:Hsp33 family molecular chaperone HslO [Oscillospiraceae bacterium]